jgi:hypothetical protein
MATLIPISGPILVLLLTAFDLMRLEVRGQHLVRAPIGLRGSRKS